MVKIFLIVIVFASVMIRTSFLYADTAMDAHTSTERAVSAQTLVEKMLAWRPAVNEADVPNPYRDQVIAFGEDAIPALSAALMRGSEPQNAITSCLGAIGSNRSFPVLLSQYMITPKPTLAVAIGCCMSEPELTYLRDFQGLNDGQLAALFGVMLGERGRPVTNRTGAELYSEVRSRLEAVRQNCIKLNRPAPLG